MLLAAILVGGCAFDESGVSDWPEDTDPAPEPDSPPATPGIGDDPSATPVSYRMVEVSLRDPHRLSQSFFRCDDITDAGAGAVNALLRDRFSLDEDGDGFYDRSVVLTLGDVGAGAAEVPIEAMNAQCAATGLKTCVAMTPPVLSMARNNRQANGICDVPELSTIGGYSPPISLSSAPCFETEPVAFDLYLEDNTPLSDVVFSATYVDDGQQLNGTLRGFLAEPDADEVMVGEPLTPVRRLLPGGQGACANHDARDTGPAGAPGWYVYFNFVAEPVEL